MTNLLPESVSESDQFRQVEVYQSLILFRSATQLLIYNETSEEFTVINAIGQFGPMAMIRGRLLIPDTEDGLMELKAGRLTKLGALS